MIILLVPACSGKTTVRDEMVDKTPRAEKQTENPAQKDTTAQPEQTKQDPQQPGTQPEPRPAPGQDESGSNKGTPPVPGTDDRTENSGGKEARDAYLNQEITYPGSTEQSSGFNPPMSPGRSGKSFLSNDTPEQITGWYQNKFGESASMSTRQVGSSTEYHLTITDSAKGYKSDIMVTRFSPQGQTTIMIRVEDA
jgi:hypothetical protein